MKIAIKHDLFDIASRIKELNSAYEIYFDTATEKYELWANGKRQLIFPFENLDERAIKHAYYTRVENIAEIEKMIDRENELLQAEEVKNVQNRFEDEFSRELRLRGI